MRLLLLTCLFILLSVDGAGKDFFMAPNVCLGKPIDPDGGRKVEFSLGNINLDQFNQQADHYTISFEGEKIKDLVGQKLDLIEFDSPLGMKIALTGFKLKNDPAGATSSPNCLEADGKEKQCTAAIEFDRPVAAVGMSVLFATGTITVKFFKPNGDVLFAVEQNGQGAKHEAGWAPYFIAWQSSDGLAVIKRIEFSRSNITETSALPGFTIDDLSFVIGKAAPVIIVPKFKEQNLLPLTRTKSADICPTMADGVETSLAKDGDYLVWRYGEDTAYRFKPEAGLKTLQGKIGNGDWLALTPGMEVRVGTAPNGELIKTLVDADRREFNGVYRHSDAKGTAEVKLSLRLSGKSLRLELTSNKAVVASIMRPKMENIVDLSEQIPFLGYANIIAYLPSRQWFYSYLVDWTKSNSSMVDPSVQYQPTLAGKYHSLHEVISITLSDNIDEVLPSIPNPASPYRNRIADSLVLECWYYNFDQLGDLLDLYHDYGMDKVIVLAHRWQAFGFDRKLPVIMPPDVNRGGLELLAREVRRAVARGQTVALHENYVDMYPDSPWWNKDDLLLTLGGSFQNSWADSKHLSPSKIMKYAQRNMPEIKEKIGTNACFLDVHSTHAPWWRTDFNPKVPDAGMLKGTLNFNNQMWQYARTNYQGPVFGEGFGPASWLHAGNIDSVMGQTAQTARLFADFILLKIRPLSVNHGVGYFERWNTRGYKSDWMTCPLLPDEMDDYVASIIAYQTAATVDDKIRNIITLVAREYYQIRPVISRLADRKVVGIVYHDDEKWLSPSQAIVSDQKKVRRIKITFDDGTMIYVNRSSTSWRLEDGTALGSGGFKVSGKNVSAVSNVNAQGQFFDYFGSPSAYFLDPRTHDWAMNPIGSINGGRNNGEAPIRCNSGDTVVAEGAFETNIAVSCVKEENGWKLRFFPQKACGIVKINLDKVNVAVTNVIALDRDGNEVKSSKDVVNKANGQLRIERKDVVVWSYLLVK